MRFYVEQRAWLLGGELAEHPRTELDLQLNALFGREARATVRHDQECFSNFDSPLDYDHLRIDFDSMAIEALRQRISRRGFEMVRFGSFSMASAACWSRPGC